jgi:hypothetical protein
MFSALKEALDYFTWQELYLAIAVTSIHLTGHVVHKRGRCWHKLQTKWMLLTRRRTRARRHANYIELLDAKHKAK